MTYCKFVVVSSIFHMIQGDLVHWAYHQASRSLRYCLALRDTWKQQRPKSLSAV